MMHSSSPSSGENPPASSPSFSSQSLSPHTTMSTPDHHHDGDNNENPATEDDIWGSSSPSPDPNSQSGRHDRTRGEMLSDVPTLRRQHITSGYREGLSIGKARVMQSGFDAGYPIGMVIGSRVGKVLGVLEGMLAAVKANGRENNEMRKGLEKVLDDAKRELDVRNLLEGLGDDVIAELNSNTRDEGDQETMETVSTMDMKLPKQIERVVTKWEVMVLGDQDQRSD